MDSQVFESKAQLSLTATGMTLEINTNHPVIVDLLAKVMASESDAAAGDTAEVLVQMAIIESGYVIADPSMLANRVYRMMSK